MRRMLLEPERIPDCRASRPRWTGRVAKRVLAAGVLAVTAALATGCDSNGGNTPAPTDSPDAGNGEQPDWYTPNPNCPELVGPFYGPGSASGACCFRGKPNSISVEEQQAANPGENVEIFFRTAYMVQSNHPNSLSLSLLTNLAVQRGDAEQQTVIIGFDAPRGPDGGVGTGEGILTVGVGRYNCDGTYSYYSDTAAPIGKAFEGGDDRGRWEKQQVRATFDGSKSGRETAVVAFADNYNGKSYLPFVRERKTDTGEIEYVYDWEIVTQGFDITQVDTDPSKLDCQGERTSNGTWVPGSEFIVFTALEDNHFPESNTISQLMGLTFSQLVAFGMMADTNSDPLATPRCDPEAAGCDWVKLPKFLCPRDEDERALFRCHAGADNEEGFPVNCTETPPETPRDGMDGTDDEGQCCDPYGRPESGLPACNAYVLVNEAVAASAVVVEDGPLVERCEP